MNANVIRPMFCQGCFDTNHPQVPDRFVSMQRGALFVQVLDSYVPKMYLGFTPHLITEFNDLDEKVFIKAFCTMEHCGIKISRKGRTLDNYNIHLINAKIIVMLHNDWKALLQYKDSDYSLLNYVDYGIQV